MSPSPLVIGVDGGGTKTVAWLAPLQDDGTNAILGRGQAGPGNPRAAGFDVAQGNIALAVQYAFDDAKLSRIRVAAACLGLAGAGRPSEQTKIAAWAEKFGIASRVEVTGDAEPILAAASPDNCGIALICGTGSLAWGRNQQGEMARCGGWGYLLGDEGSAYAIALAGLQAAMQFADGRGERTSLLGLFQQELAVSQADGLVEEVYRSKMTRERLATLAKVVFDAVDSDAVARSLIDAAAQDLAAMIAVLSRRLHLSPGDYLLALAGSVVLNQRPFRESILGHLSTVSAAPGSMHCVPEPVRGAVALARLIAQGVTRPTPN